jgi:cytoskeletal protein RodZ
MTTTHSPERPDSRGAATRAGDAVMAADAPDATPPPSTVTPPVPMVAAARGPTETLGAYLRHHRRARSMSLAEVSRITRIPGASLDAIEGDRFDELPGEVFVRGFLRAYAQAIGLLPDEVLARYTSSRRIAYVTPLPMQTPLQAAHEGQGRRFGVAIAFVLLLILLSLALSIVLKPRGRDMPAELSRSEPGTSAGVTLDG